MPLTNSFGVFTSASAVRSASHGDLQRLYWQTTNQHHFQGRTLSEADQNESMDQVHLIGHQNTKYMRLPEKRSPLVDRSASSYATAFGAKPVGDAAMNREFAAAAKGATRMTPAPSIDNRTTYHDAFNPGRTTEELRAARLPSQGDRQARTATISGVDGSLERVSQSQRIHRGPCRELPTEVRSARPRSPIKDAAAARPADFWSTQYQRDSLSCTSLAWPAASAAPLEKALDFEWAPRSSRPRLTLALPPNIELGA